MKNEKNKKNNIINKKSKQSIYPQISSSLYVCQTVHHSSSLSEA